MKYLATFSFVIVTMLSSVLSAQSCPHSAPYYQPIVPYVPVQAQMHQQRLAQQMAIQQRQSQYQRQMQQQQHLAMQRDFQVREMQRRQFAQQQFQMHPPIDPRNQVKPWRMVGGAVGTYVGQDINGMQRQAKQQWDDFRKPLGIKTPGAFKTIAKWGGW